MAKSKLKSTLFRSKFILAVFAVGFAGLGTYLITNSSAGPPTGYGVASVQVAEMNLAGQLTGANVPDATIHIYPTPAEASYVCTQGSSPANWGSSLSGVGAFTCGSWSAGRAYIADAGKTGYVSRGGYQATVHIGQTTVFRVILQLTDGDGDGYADLYDSCPSQGNGGYGMQGNGCPNPPPPPNVSFPTDLTVRVSPIEYGGSTSMYWSSINGTACSLEKASVTNGAIGAFGNGTPTPIGAQERGTGALTATTAYRVYCSGINGGGAGYSSARVITVNPQKPGPTCAEQGKTGVYPNCVTIITDPKCPASAPGTWPNCIKVVTTNTTNTRVVTRTSTAPANASDKEKPSTPQNFKGEQVGGGEIDLSWDASTDNVGVTGYTLERSSDSGSEWTMLDDAIVDTSYADSTAEFGTTYSYRLSAKDAAGNFSDYVLVDIETNEFQANVTADEDSTLTSDDGIVEVEFPAGALKEDAFCEITKDSVSGAPKGYKLAAGGYTIECRNKAGDSITKLEKDIKVTMHLKSYAKKFSSFAAYSIDGSSLSPLQATFDSANSDLKFELDELVTFAAYGAKKSSMWWIWVLVALAVVGIILLILKLRGGGGGSDDYYDTTDYVSMPPNQGGPLDTGAGGYEHHPSLPEMVAGGDQQPYPPQQNPPQAGPNNYPNPPLPPQQ